MLKIYVDDGYSGLNFNRPAFNEMLSDIESGKIKMDITKDLSRLGRDYIQTGYYTEIYFPDHKVRYIALSDGIDTINQNNDIAPFKNILNDMYAKDLSRKVKLAKRSRALDGLFISAQTPFGYMKDTNNKNHLIVDEEAKNPNSIFYGDERAMEGMAPEGYVLHHPYGRYGSKIGIYEPVSVVEHKQIHSSYGYGQKTCGFNNYYKFDNIWEWFRMIS